MIAIKISQNIFQTLILRYDENNLFPTILFNNFESKEITKKYFDSTYDT